MLINCAGLKGLSKMIILSATFIIIIFPQICDKHQTILTPIFFLYLTSLIAHQSYALVTFYCRVYVPHLRFLRVRCPNNAEMVRFLRLTHLGRIAQPFFEILNFIVLQLLSNRNKLNLFKFHLLLLLFFGVCLVPSTSTCRGLFVV